MFFALRENKSSTILSKLIWEVDSVVVLGGSGSIELGRWSVNGGAWVAVTEGDGKMEDYDRDANGSSWKYYSVSHDTDIEHGILIDVNTAYRIISDMRGFDVSILAGYKYDNWKWEANGGTLYYPQFDYIPVELPDIPVITYEQNSHAVFGLDYVGRTRRFFVMLYLCKSTCLRGGFRFSYERKIS